MLALQIALGGWTSSNYAASRLPGPADLPAIPGGRRWISATRSFCGAVSASTTRAACSRIPARVAIHFTHRLGAVVAGSSFDRHRDLGSSRAPRGRPLRFLGGLAGVRGAAADLHRRRDGAFRHLRSPSRRCTTRGAAFLVIVMVTLLRALWPRTWKPRRPGHRSPHPPWYPCAVSTLPDNPPLAAAGSARLRWRDYLELTKPKVSSPDRVHRHRGHGARLARHGAAARADLRHPRHRARLRIRRRLQSCARSAHR